MSEPHTKLTLENEHGAFSVELSRDSMPLPDAIEYLIEPLLIAAGYDAESVREALS